MNFSNYPFIRLIPFATFKSHGCIPRYPEDAHCTISLCDLTQEEYERSLIIFVSHCWLRGWSGAEGWDGRPHPDTVDAGKYQLCIDGIEKVMKIMAPGMQNCYLWIDFGCIDQDGNPEGELRMLDKIMRVCDCLFTPIYDKDHINWQFPDEYVNLYDGYRSSVWNGTDHSYLNRGWCRVEMFYAVNIPLIENLSSHLSRKDKFALGFAFHYSEGKRPHLLFGSKEVHTKVLPRILPPLENSYFDKFHPCDGAVTVARDKWKIQGLVQALESNLKFRVQPGYKGELKDGKRHGNGEYTSASGKVFIGEWQDDKKNGYGRIAFPNGSVYEGEWKDDKQHGIGIYTSADGSVYSGEWQDDKNQGQGKFTSANGDVYEGYWKEGKKNGQGKFLDANGFVYEGDWKDDKKVDE
jgi:hypothetical protein